MKKIIAVLLVVMAVVALAACGPKGGNSGGGSADTNKDYYGTWTCAKLESIDGSISDDIFEITRKQMKENDQLFYFEFGDKSYIYNPDNNGGYDKLEIVMEYENGRMYNASNKSDEILFTVKDGMIVIDEPDSGVRFYMAKE